MRPQKIENGAYHRLDATDDCYYIGEYTAHGGFNASDTNQQILNLKISPASASKRLYWKDRAVNYWADVLADVFDLDALAKDITLIPAPCSKPEGHPDYDDRMLRVLQRLAGRTHGIDVRPLILTANARRSQHEGERLTHEELVASMAINEPTLRVPLRQNALIVDDVFTQGCTFKAMQQVVRDRTGIRIDTGLFLAKTIWPNIVVDLDNLTF